MQVFHTQKRGPQGILLCWVLEGKVKCAARGQILGRSRQPHSDLPSSTLTPLIQRTLPEVGSGVGSDHLAYLGEEGRVGGVGSQRAKTQAYWRRKLGLCPKEWGMLRLGQSLTDEEAGPWIRLGEALEGQI